MPELRTVRVQTSPGGTCPTCVWWDGGDAEIGHCRRHAPTLYVAWGNGLKIAWPETPRDSWCGEFTHTPTPAVGDGS